MADGAPHAEFDAYADDYEAQHAASIKASGESTEFFARYKAQDAARFAAKTGLSPRRVLDFGTGLGASLPHLAEAFPGAALTGLDPSQVSLDRAAAAYPGLADLRAYDGETLPFSDDSFDLAFTACVFHHVPEDRHPGLLGEIRRVLRPGGAFFLFEHNPANPLTRRAVRLCPFDADAVLIDGRTMRRRIEAAGFDTALRYRLFVPGALRALRPLERALSWCPLGAQYHVHAR